jgi:hypothetical protein
MKDGRTHLAHKAEHAVDLSSGAVVEVTLQAADLGDTMTMQQTLQEAQANAVLVNERGVEDRGRQGISQQPRWICMRKAFGVTFRSRSVERGSGRTRKRSSSGCMPIVGA